jgi:DNA-binding transcriptional LysR family regulator
VSCADHGGQAEVQSTRVQATADADLEYTVPRRGGGDAHAGLRRIAVPRPPPERALWLGVHRDARTIPRVRAVIAFLADELRRLQPAFAPGA